MLSFSFHMHGHTYMPTSKHRQTRIHKVLSLLISHNKLVIFLSTGTFIHHVGSLVFVDVIIIHFVAVVLTVVATIVQFL